MHISDPDRPTAPPDHPLMEELRRSSYFDRMTKGRRTGPVTGSRMIGAMDDAGVRAAVLVSAIGYGWDSGYAVEVAARQPDRFRVVGLLDHNAPDVADRMRDWANQPHAVGVRAVFLSDVFRDQLLAGAFERYLAAAERESLPVFLFGPDYLPELTSLVRAHPGVRFVFDHFGLGTEPDPAIDEKLPAVLALADLPNVAVKISGGPALSSRPYPFDDLWPVLERYLERFGTGRLYWGSDWTRVPNGTYAEAVRSIRDSDRLSTSDKAAIMGGSLRTALKWTP